MNGHWHLTALAAGISALTIIYGHYWLMVVFFIWLIYLYLFRGLNVVPIMVACTGLLFFLFYIPSQDISTVPPAAPDNASVTGTIKNSINETSAYIQFVLHEENTQQKVQVTYFKQDAEPGSRILNDTNIRYGARCRLDGDTEKADEASNPGQFDYRDYLYEQGIDRQMTIDGLKDMSCKGAESPGSRVLSLIYASRSKMVAYVHSHLSSFSAAWVSALIFGDDSFLPEAVTDLFQHWGLSHLLAISGLHVGLIVSLLYFILNKLNVLTKERAQMLVMTFLPVYALLAGGAPSVWRASLMVFMILLFYKLHIRVSVTDVISLVFIGLLMLDPLLTYQVGFQLSFIVAFALLLSKKWLNQSKHPLFLLVQVSFVSQIAIVPLQIGYFSVFQPLSIILNVLVVPYFTMLVIPFMFILLFSSPIPFLSGVLDMLFKSVHNVFMWVLEAVDRVADYPFILGSFPLIATILYYVFFLLMMKQVELRKNIKAFLYGMLLVSILVGLTVKPYLSSEGRVTMLDVGQGDSFVIELPYRKAVIFYDAAAKVSFTDERPTDSVYKNVIKPYLYSRGIGEIDTIMLSHEHIDHMGSVSHLLADFPVKRIATQKFYENPEAIQTEWDKHPTNTYTFEKGDKISIRGHDFFVLSPGYDKDSPNENSMVLFTEFGGKKWLFTGDMEDQTEKDIMADFPNLEVDVHQAGHHGSDTSTSEAFIHYLNPDYSLISVGRNNRYGFPNESVLEHIAEADTMLLRTDEHGAVTFRFKDGEGFFDPFISK